MATRADSSANSTRVRMIFAVESDTGYPEKNSIVFTFFTRGKNLMFADVLSQVLSSEVY